MPTPGPSLQQSTTSFVMPRYLIWISAVCLLILAVQDIAAYKPRPTKAQLRYMLGWVEVVPPVAQRTPPRQEQLRTPQPG